MSREHFWSVPKLWDGGECWIIGGGASIPRQFGVPEGIIEKVQRTELPLSTYSQYLTPLHNKNVIGVNLAFLLGDWISMMYFCDAHVFRGYKAKIHQFHNLKVTCAQSFGEEMKPEMVNIKRLKRDNNPGLSFNPEFICWNHNSGAAAINFAALAGAKRILLLGFDMKAENGQTHWVNSAGGHLYKTPGTTSQFRMFMKRFPYIAKQAKEKGIEILNVNPDSALPDFVKVPLQSVL